jgi:putative transposase
VTYQLIEAEEANHQVTTLCRTLGVSRSGYYDWRKRGPSKRELANRKLTAEVCAVFKEHDGRLGEPRLRSQLSTPASKKRVARIMRENGLVARQKRRFVQTTVADEKAPKAPNILDRNFTAVAPNRAWVGDITYIPTREGWLYLAVLIDLFSRAVVGWKLSESLEATIVVDTLQQAVTRRQPQADVLVHVDRGSQYTSVDHVAAIERHGMVLSMSRKGNCWDNAVAESFFSTLKMELGLVHDSAASRAEARHAIGVYIERYYNRKRPHSTIGNMSPLGYEHNFRSASELAA